MARKKKHEEHENHERWLVSYADFITLLFAFFVVMYSVSAVNEGKYRVLSDSLAAAFRAPAKSLAPVQTGNPMRAPLVPHQDQNPMAPTRPGAVPPVQMPMLKPQTDQRAVAAAAAQAKIEAERATVISQIAEEMEKALAALIDKELVNVRRTKFWMEVEIKTSILFPSGSAQLARSATATLDKVAVILNRYPNPIHVEGFTDNKPIRTPAFPSNWELSAARAASVVHLFSSSGIKPERMAAIGYGEHQPVADNATPEGRNTNRRVVLVVLADPSVHRLRDHSQEGGQSDGALDGAGTTSGMGEVDRVGNTQSRPRLEHAAEGTPVTASIASPAAPSRP
ncbi:MAG TPA: flagellar motor protein MotD [Acidiferrobacterales bacterium]|nr:flagellar motor protein MotD [Acidiferrobacterales bacterium]